jgi:spermidine synthase
LTAVNGTLVDDSRVTIFIDDVWNVLARAPQGQYDAIVIDIDNGPAAMVQKPNFRLYHANGIRMIIAALKPGGRVVVWSAARDDAFANRLAVTGLQVQSIPAKLYANAKRCGCTLYIADKPLS